MKAGKVLRTLTIYAEKRITKTLEDMNNVNKSKQYQEQPVDVDIDIEAENQVDNHSFDLHPQQPKVRDEEDIFHFSPVDFKWQRIRTERLGISVMKKFIPRQADRKTFTVKTIPKSIVKVVGDGNCFLVLVSSSVWIPGLPHSCPRQGNEFHDERLH